MSAPGALAPRFWGNASANHMSVTSLREHSPPNQMAHHRTVRRAVASASSAKMPRKLCILGLTDRKFRDAEYANTAYVGAGRPCTALLERRVRKSYVRNVVARTFTAQSNGASPNFTACNVVGVGEDAAHLGTQCRLSHKKEGLPALTLLCVRLTRSPDRPCRIFHFSLVVFPLVSRFTQCANADPVAGDAPRRPASSVPLWLLWLRSSGAPQPPIPRAARLRRAQALVRYARARVKEIR